MRLRRNHRACPCETSGEVAPTRERTQRARVGRGAGSPGGARTATAPIARDAVGHAPAPVSCSYTVVAQPVPATPKPTIVTTTAKATSKGIVGIKVACTGATCTGTLTVRATVKVGGRKKTLKLGSKAFSVAPGRTSTVKLRLSRTNLKVLKRVRKVRSTATIQLAGATGTQAQAVVTISAPRR